MRRLTVSSLTQGTRRGTQRAQETLRALRQGLAGFALKKADAIAGFGRDSVSAKVTIRIHEHEKTI